MRKSALFLFGLVVAALVALGLIVLSSASEANAVRLHNNAYYFMTRQFMYLALGIVIAIVVAMTDYHLWRKCPWLTWLFYAGVFVLLIAVFGSKAINGSHRWIPVGPVRLQPSEFAKLAIVVVLSMWYDKLGWKVDSFVRGIVWPAVIIAILALPILFETDLGSTMVVGLTGAVIMLVAGASLPWIFGLGFLGGGVFCLRLFTNANRVARLFDERAQYQVKMALVALHNGGIFGVGLGESMQKQFYLPEAHTDFVFAVGAEELGIIFSISVVILFVLFFLLAVYIARNANDRFGRYLVIGMAFIIFFQAAFNLGVVCKALPTKGMALPFFSYGGTNLVSAFFAVGTILSVGIHSLRGGKRWKN